MVCGHKVKDAPLGRYLEGLEVNEKDGIQGDFKLHEDGIRFRYKNFSNGGFTYHWDVKQFHISTIAQARPGDKSHWLVLVLKDGRTVRFKFAGAAKWADLINQFLPNNL